MKKREVIDLGHHLLKQDYCGSWDFYRKYDKEGNLIRRTYEEFDSVKVIGEAVYVLKNDSGILKQAIYNHYGEIKISFLDVVIDCGATLLVEKVLDGSWDFYTKEGNRVTYREFEDVKLVGDLVVVLEYAYNKCFNYGVYNNMAQELIHPEWKEIDVVTNKQNGQPLYILLKNYEGSWGVANTDGSLIMTPNNLAGLKRQNEGENRILVLTDRTGKEVKYNMSENGLLKLN